MFFSHGVRGAGSSSLGSQTGEADLLVWYTGDVIDTILQQNGRRRHHVQYDGFDERDWYWHDFASDDFEWRRVDAQPPSQIPTPHVGPTTRLRSARAARAALQAVEHVLECHHSSVATDAEQRSLVDAALFQTLGDDADSFSTTPDRGVARSLALLEAAGRYGTEPIPSASHATAEPTIPIFCVARSAAAACYKATQNIVDVLTDVGIRQYAIPSSLKALQMSEQRDKWEAADQKALDSILSRPGTRLVSRRVPSDLGVPIPASHSAVLRSIPPPGGFNLSSHGTASMALA